MFRFNFDADKDEVIQESGTDVEIFCQIMRIQPRPVDVYQPCTSKYETVSFSNKWSFKQSQFDWRALPNDDRRLKTIVSSSDLASGVYEGGFKLWECAVDLVNFLIDIPSISSLNVLELGCGHGLPGIFALAFGAHSVLFQDLNHQVLEYITIPNVILNGSLEKSRFIAGDWRDQNLSAECISGGQFDVIFSCDTIYNIESQPHLVRMINECLRDNGVAYIAAKTFYFGVGGSTFAFTQNVAAFPNLECEVIKTIADGHSNVREIIRIHKHPS